MSSQSQNATLLNKVCLFVCLFVCLLVYSVALRHHYVDFELSDLKEKWFASKGCPPVSTVLVVVVIFHSKDITFHNHIMTGHIF